MTPREAVALHRLDDLGSYANGSEEKSGWSLCRMRILAAYPGIDAEKIELATIFAQANPPRGRPRAAGGELPAGAVIVSDHRRPRRKKTK
jgi:hypothetical protein